MMRLIKKVLRYKADPKAVADFAKDADPTGNIALPMVSINAVNDPTVFVEIADFWKQKVEKAGKGTNLVQTFANDNQHSYISDVHYVSIMNGLLEWINTKKKTNCSQYCQTVSIFRCEMGYERLSLLTRI
ncbi:MAG: hypothetical protein LRY68_08015 [Sulfurospirillum sp.]|nr:hypothetical protein [Sulfurospirillum sp.]